MPRVKMSASFIKSARCLDGSNKTDFFDLGQRGFMLEVRRSGGKTFYQRYTDDRGRERQFKIGPADVLSLSEARRKAKAVAAQALVGTDPRQHREALRTIPTLAELVRDRYLPHVKGYKRSWKTDETILRLHILPVLGSNYVDLVMTDAIAAIIVSMRARGYATGTTNRVVIVLRHIFNLARKWRIAEVTENPTAGLNLAPDVNRERFLSLEEVGRLVRAITEDENKGAANAIMILLLTGARRNEISQARWEWVAWDKKALLVPMTKSGKPRSIALGPAVIEILRSIVRTPDTPFIFPSPVTGRPSPSLHFPWSRIRKRARLPDLRLHDLRHSFASFLVNEGESLYVVQGLLGHGSSRYTQRYAHLTPSTLLDAAEALGNIIAGAAGASENTIEDAGAKAG